MELNHDVIDAQARHGRQLLHEDGHAALDEEFDLTDYLLDQWEADFAV